MADHGCNAAGVPPRVVRHHHQSRLSLYTFVPQRSPYLSRAPSKEIEVRHGERALAPPKYSVSRLVQLNFDLHHGFSGRDR
jgi:hypothetical protein